MRSEFKYILGFVAVLVVLFLIKKAIRKRENKKAKTADVDKSNLNADTDYEALALSLYNIMDGLLETGEQKVAVFEKMMDLNDDEFKEVHNIFNLKYAHLCFLCNENTTFREWVLGESTGYAYEDFMNDFIARFDRLQLP